MAVAGILQTIKEKVVQGADDAYNSDQRAAIQGQIDALVDEIDAIAQETSFQGTKLIDGSFTGKLFQTGGSAGDTFMVSLNSAASSAFNGFVGGGGDPEVVFGANDTLAFDENGSSLTATLTPGTYSRAGLATELQSALNAASVKPGLSYAVTYDGGTEKYTISKAGGGPTTIVLKWTDAASAGLAGLLGFYTNANDSIFNGGGSVPIGVSDYVPTSGAGLSVANASIAATTLTYVDQAIGTLNTITQKVGEYTVRSIPRRTPWPCESPIPRASAAALRTPTSLGNIWTLSRSRSSSRPPSPPSPRPMPPRSWSSQSCNKSARLPDGYPSATGHARSLQL